MGYKWNIEYLLKSWPDSCCSIFVLLPPVSSSKPGLWTRHQRDKGSKYHLHIQMSDRTTGYFDSNNDCPSPMVLSHSFSNMQPKIWHMNDTTWPLRSAIACSAGFAVSGTCAKLSDVRCWSRSWMIRMQLGIPDSDHGCWQNEQIKCVELNSAHLIVN